MNFNFELILFYAVVVSGVIALFDLMFFRYKRRLAAKQAGHPEKLPMLFDYAWSFFPVLLAVFLLRSFLYEPFRIPSSSLKPTLLVGDFILVNKFDYGIRLPVIHEKIFSTGELKRGDVIVFRWPPNPSVDYIKRVIGLPGDHISYIEKVLYVNGHKIPQTFESNQQDLDENNNLWNVARMQENLLGVKHEIYQQPDRGAIDFHDLVVPPGMYFGMGDNRDDSSDSRSWGFIPDKNIVGKAVYIWMSWDNQIDRVRWQRIFKAI